MKKILSSLFFLFFLQINAQCWKQIAMGESYVVALKTDGTLWAWGENSRGQLGNSTFSDSNIAVRVGNDNQWKYIVAGANHTIALKNDGTLWGWGSNDSGQIGINSNENINTPTQIGTDNDWEKITAGGYHNLAIKENGSLWGWGNNENYQLGISIQANKLFPIQIGTSIEWKEISAGTFHSACLKNDGTLWTWGNNAYGQLANGVMGVLYVTLPTKVSPDTDWKTISSSAQTSIALKSDNTLWAFGDYFGYIPSKISLDEDWKSISCSGWTSYMLKNNGTLWAIGNNYYGQIGNGTTTESNELLMVNDNTDWHAVFSRESTAAAIKTDGTLWIWGRNDTSQALNGTTESVLSPSFIDCSIASLQEQDFLSFSIYPNPAQNALYIQNPENTVIESLLVTDVNGKIIIQKTGTVSQIDISPLQQGIYFLKVTSPSGTTTLKLIKQ